MPVKKIIFLLSLHHAWNLTVSTNQASGTLKKQNRITYKKQKGTDDPPVWFSDLQIKVGPYKWRDDEICHQMQQADE